MSSAGAEVEDELVAAVVLLNRAKESLLDRNSPPQTAISKTVICSMSMIAARQGIAPEEHEARHRHGSGCGHEAVPHRDHTDYLVDGRLLRPHCDDHGPLAVVLH